MFNRSAQKREKWTEGRNISRNNDWELLRIKASWKAYIVPHIGWIGGKNTLDILYSNLRSKVKSKIFKLSKKKRADKLHMKNDQINVSFLNSNPK